MTEKNERKIEEREKRREAMSEGGERERSDEGDRKIGRKNTIAMYPLMYAEPDRKIS